LGLETREKVELRRRAYNEERPQIALGKATPEEFAARIMQILNG
jgi:transposase InsO family protein